MPSPLCPAAPQPKSANSALAPAWHTALLVGLILLVACLGMLLSHGAVPAPPSSGSRLLALYVPMLIAQWAQAAYVCRIGRPSNAFSELLGTRWTSFGRALVDVTLAVLSAGAIEAIDLAWSRALRDHAHGVRQLLPQTALEHGVWLLVALSAGVCEELVYRGYLIRQLTAFARSSRVAVLGQALLFGVAHLEQGTNAALCSGVYGLVLGAVALGRRSLIPGMLAHVAIDVMSGFFG